MKPSTAQAEARVPVAASACRFSVKRIDDHRDHAGLGTMGRTVIDGEGFASWFANGVAAIPGYSVDAAPIEVQVEVLKAYIQALGSLKSANLVVRVQFARHGVSSLVKTYRGVDGSVNWSNSESEVQVAFDNALASLKLQMSADIEALCKR